MEGDDGELAGGGGRGCIRISEMVSCCGLMMSMQQMCPRGVAG